MRRDPLIASIHSAPLRLCPEWSAFRQRSPSTVAPAAPPQPHAQRLQVLWLAWFLALLFHTELGLMPLFHGLSPQIESQVDPARLPAVFWAMLLYFLVPLVALLLISYAATSSGPWRRWRWFHLGLGIVYSLTNIGHMVVDILIPDSRSDQVTLMAVMVVIGLLINLESWRWCDAG